jgi:hypothetical protein
MDVVSFHGQPKDKSMRTLCMIMLASLLSAPSCWVIAQAQNVPTPSGAAAPESTAPAPVVSTQVDDLLKQMADYIGSAEQFTFHADIIFDHVLPSGQKLQFSATEDVALQRPGRLYVEWSGDLGDRQFWYDGKSVTLYDPATPFYASEAAPPAIDSMLGGLIPRLNFSPPLADFLYKDPYQSVRGNIQYGFYLGLNDVDGRSCHTLAFVEKDIDWQIWIDAGPQLTPCKLVITYKAMPAQPQFIADFTDWDFAPRIAAPVFTPTLPAGTQKIPFQTVAAAK